MNVANVVLMASGALVLISVSTFGGLAWHLSRGGEFYRPSLTGPFYTPVVASEFVAKAGAWEVPMPLSRGHDWIYEVFTPPEIFYRARTRQFVVVPPPGNGGEILEIPFGLELVSVKRESFRLQLIGYVGNDPDPRGVFENRIDGEVFLAVPGRQVPDLALSIESFAVHREPIGLPDSMSINQRAATAVVHDEKSGQDVILTQRERHPGGTVSAFVAASGSAAVREVRAGDVFEIGEASYRVEAISCDPAQIEVMRTLPSSGAHERRTLSPRFDPAASAAIISP